MKRSTLDKLRAARKLLDRQPEPVLILVPPLLAEDVHREHPELSHIITTMAEPEITNWTQWGRDMRIHAVAIMKEGKRVDPAEFFAAPPPRWPDDVPVPLRQIPER